LPELSVTDHHRSFHARSVDLIENMERGGERLGEHGALVGQRLWHFHQATLGDGESLGECARATDDPKHRPFRAVMAALEATLHALAAPSIDVGNDALADPRRIVCRDDIPDDLMSGHAREAHVAAGEL